MEATLGQVVVVTTACLTGLTGVYRYFHVRSTNAKIIVKGMICGAYELL